MDSLTPTVKIHFEWLSPAEQTALSTVVNQAARGEPDATIRPFTRFGMSDAKLVLVYFLANPGAKPFLAKINKASKIRDEVKACESAKIYFPDDTFVIVDKYEGTSDPGSMGAVCYVHVAAQNHAELEKVKELKELAFAVRAKSSERKCIKGLDTLYKKMANAHSSAREETVRIADEYTHPIDYLRLNANKKKETQGTRALLQSALGSKVKRKTFEIFGVPAFNPSLMLDRLLGQEIKCHIGPIHGDLHTSNVVFTPHGQPKLVDFAWATPKGHILKDFVLMENSIRFMVFPGNVIHEKELLIDRLLVAEDGGFKLAEISSGNDWADMHCNRMGEMITVIRDAAKRAIGAKWDFREYLIAQFLLLVGSLEHYHYNFRESVRTLGAIAHELKKRGV